MWSVRLHFDLKLLISFISLLLLLLVNAIADSEIEDEPSFSYVIGAPNGPDNWGNNPNWALCGTGSSQSPVNIFGLTAVNMPSLGTLDRQYKAAPALLKKREHDIEVEWTGDAGEIILSGNQFKLVQCHFHIPAEHTLNSIRFAMELHMVHVNSGGDIAVVGILYTLGWPDPFIQKISPYLQAANEEGVNLGSVNPSDIKFSAKHYYRYNGSLTTPPCSENVIWTVIKKVRTASIQQINAIRAAVDDDENTGNARPVQPLNGRTIYSYTGI